MKRIVGAIFLAILAAAPVSATSITWSSATLSDDNGGAFLTGASASGAGNLWTLLLPNYSVSGNFGLPPNEVDVSVSAKASGGNITGVTYRYFAVFTGVGGAAFVQTANAASALGTFGVPLRTGFLPVAPTAVLNLLALFNLDGGDIVDAAAITKVQFELTTVDTVPEPSTIALVAAGAAVLMQRRLWKRRRCEPTGSGRDSKG